MNYRIPSSPPKILPVNGVERPLWSVMIPTYNCTNYLRETLQSVLAQDPGPDKMQIEVVDDDSSDGDPRAVVDEIGKGRVSFFQQKKNVGSLRNFETCLNRSRGHLVHILHGDDLVVNGFYNEINSLYKAFPEIGAAFTRHSYIDNKGSHRPPDTALVNSPGIVKDFLGQIAQKPIPQAVSMVVRRRVYEQLGGFFAVHYGEDWEMWIRIAANYPVAYSPKCYAIYRSGEGHSSSITSNFLKSGQNIRDILQVIDIVQAYLPEARRKKLKRLAKMNYSRHYAKASHMIYKHCPATAFVQANGALKMNHDLKTIYWVFKLYLLHTARTILGSFTV